MPRPWPVVMQAYGKEQFGARDDSLLGICRFIGIKIRFEALFVDHESVQRGVEGGVFFTRPKRMLLGS
jgi:hypothetical protein